MDVRKKKQRNSVDLSITAFESWYDEPKFIQYWADKLKKRMNRCLKRKRNSVLIVSAHSLPEKIIAGRRSISRTAAKTAKMIAEEARVRIMRSAGKVQGIRRSLGLGQMFKI